MQSNAAVWSALKEAYSGSEDELQLAVLESDTYESLANEYSPQGRPRRDQSSDRAGPDASFMLARGADSLVREPGQVCGSRLLKCRDATNMSLSPQILYVHCVTDLG